MSIKGAIFDLDGVIVNSAKFHYLGWKRLADDIGIPFDEVRNEKLKGLSRRDSLMALMGDQFPKDEKKVTELCDRKNKYYVDSIQDIDRSEMLPGALQLIEAISKNSGWKQALASSSRNAKFILKKLDIEKYFGGIVDGNDTEKTKPDPELFLIAARKIGIPPSQAIVFEDAESGVQAAKSGGFIAVGLGDPKILHKADLVVKDLSEVDLSKMEKLFSKVVA
jgi:beta-phosphoglucomutase